MSRSFENVWVIIELVYVVSRSQKKSFDKVRSSLRIGPPSVKEPENEFWQGTHCLRIDLRNVNKSVSRHRLVSLRFRLPISNN